MSVVVSGSRCCCSRVSDPVYFALRSFRKQQLRLRANLEESSHSDLLFTTTITFTSSNTFTLPTQAHPETSSATQHFLHFRAPSQSSALLPLSISNNRVSQSSTAFSQLTRPTRSPQRIMSERDADVQGGRDGWFNNPAGNPGPGMDTPRRATAAQMAQRK